MWTFLESILSRNDLQFFFGQKYLLPPQIFERRRGRKGGENLKNKPMQRISDSRHFNRLSWKPLCLDLLCILPRKPCEMGTSLYVLLGFIWKCFACRNLKI
ncbi:uncharacterized protein ACOB8E_012999 [Sarcophilus harrisii]